MATAKKRLGRGLGGLIRGSGQPVDSTGPERERAQSVESPAGAGPSRGRYLEAPTDRIDPNPYQPRREFSAEQIRELAESIRSEGLLQPILVREQGDRFQLIAGERRWRACRELKMKAIPARVIEAGDASSAAMSLIENLQREDLNPIDEALGYASLMRDFDLTQESVAERMGRARASIANSLRLLTLGRELQGYVGSGRLSVGHAKVLLGVEDADQRAVLARRAIEEGWSVREAERRVQRLREGSSRSRGRRHSESELSALRDVEKRISSGLQTVVQVRPTAGRKGRIVIEYQGNDDLHRILEKMGIAE